MPSEPSSGEGIAAPAASGAEIGDHAEASGRPIASGEARAFESDVGAAGGRPSTSREPFYVGYLPAAPPPLAAHTRRVVIALALVVPVIAALVAWAQGPFESGVFEFGVTRSFEGVLYETPVPMLRLAAPEAGPARGGARLLLVGFGKHGLPEVARGHHAQRVAFDGSLIYRRGLAMIEMNDLGSFRVLGDAPQAPRAESLGEITLTGELVDTKCFSGVMRPATGKVHRGCAVRCLAGGIPPGLLVRGPGGTGTVFVLAGAGERPLDFDVQWAARTVRARGELELLDGLPVLRVSELALAAGG